MEHDGVPLLHGERSGETGRGACFVHGEGVLGNCEVHGQGVSCNCEIHGAGVFRKIRASSRKGYTFNCFSIPLKT